MILTEDMPNALPSLRTVQRFVREAKLEKARLLEQRVRIWPVSDPGSPVDIEEVEEVQFIAQATQVYNLMAEDVKVRRRQVTVRVLYVNETAVLAIRHGGNDPQTRRGTSS